MDKKTLTKIKEKLEVVKKDITEELAIFAKKDSKDKDNYQAKFPDYGSKDDENAAEVATYGDNLSLEHRLEKMLKDVNKSLERIKKGSYGTCKYCQKPINPKRLLARPVSSACVKCKSELQNKNVL